MKQFSLILCISLFFACNNNSHENCNSLKVKENLLVQLFSQPDVQKICFKTGSRGIMVISLLDEPFGVEFLDLENKRISIMERGHDLELEALNKSSFGNNVIFVDNKRVENKLTYLDVISFTEDETLTYGFKPEKCGWKYASVVKGSN